MASPAQLNKDHDVGLVIAAAGSSRRFGRGTNKLLSDLNGMPVICYCLQTFLKVIDPHMVVILVAPAAEDTFRSVFAHHGIPESIIVTTGGRQRQDSVYRGLCALPNTVNIAVIQDGARPYSSVGILRACIASARERGSGIAAKRVVDTIKIATPDGKVVSTPDRNKLWAVETPQVFKRDLIQRCYQHVIDAGHHVTDDGQALEICGKPVYLVEHHEMNAKITYARDLQG